MSKKNIIFIGFMGSGKTSIALHLSKLLNLTFIDTDQLIIKSSGKSIETLFSTSEAYFRSWEKNICKTLKSKQNSIISTGGGIILDDDCRQIIRSIGHVIYLEASAKTILERTKNKSHRPLLNQKDPYKTIENLLNQRADLYQSTAHLTINVDPLSIQQISDKIIAYYDLKKT